MKIAAYQQGDEFLLDPREAPLMIDPSWAWTLYNNGKPVAIIGCTEFFGGVGHIWAIVDEEVRKRGIRFTKYCKLMLEETIREKNYHRIQAFVASDVEENKRWINLLGLVYEGTMKKATADKRDLDIYGRVI